jgi:hypothetical protein
MSCQYTQYCTDDLCKEGTNLLKDRFDGINFLGRIVNAKNLSRKLLNTVYK